jgi:hypothetical protein
MLSGKDGKMKNEICFAASCGKLCPLRRTRVDFLAAPRVDFLAAPRRPSPACAVEEGCRKFLCVS